VFPLTQGIERIHFPLGVGEASLRGRGARVAGKLTNGFGLPGKARCPGDTESSGTMPRKWTTRTSLSARSEGSAEQLTRALQCHSARVLLGRIDSLVALKHDGSSCTTRRKDPDDTCRTPPRQTGCDRCSTAG
jgi:hypothetical protein